MLLVVLLVGFLVSLVSAQGRISVSPTTTLRDAIAIAEGQWVQFPSIAVELVLESGVYVIDNDGTEELRSPPIVVNFPLQIIGAGSDLTTIKGNFVAGGLLIEGGDYLDNPPHNVLTVTLSGITFLGCVAPYGGALGISTANVLVSNCSFVDNHANYGGALYATEASIVQLHNITFYVNDAFYGGGAIYVDLASQITMYDSQISCNEAVITSYDISCAQGTAIVMDADNDDDDDGDVFGCSNGCKVTISGSENNICPRAPVCTFLAGSLGPISEPGGNDGATCGDGVCDITQESCLSCPLDCSCMLNGVRYDLLDCLPLQPCPPPTVSTMLDYPHATGTGDPVFSSFGQFTGNFSVAVDGEYSFNVLCYNCGAQLTINSKILVNAFFQQDFINSTGSVFLLAGETNLFYVQFFSFFDGPYSINVTRTDLPPTVRYLQYAVNYDLSPDNFGVPGVPTDPNEQVSRKPIRALRDAKKRRVKRDDDAPTCGDGQCQEADPNLCISDCWDQITPVCSAQASPPSIVGPYKFDDTVGTLLKNQYLYRLPGLDSIQHGVDILTGLPIPTPLFSFSFCDNTSLRVIQDSYRGLTYTVPSEVFASMNTKCSFETDSEVFTSATAMSLETADSYSLSASASLQTKYVGISGAYSREKSVEAAQSLETATSGSIVRTQVECEISRIMMAKYTFHPQFLYDISRAENITSMLTVVQKYGTHYFKTATLGGKLVQVSFVDSSVTSTMTQEDIAQNSAIDFAASVSAPVFQAQASVLYSQDTTQSAENQGIYTNGSSTSTIITYGGPPGAYGPASDAGVNTFGSWAAFVDLLPVPINYELDAIGNIIPDYWFTPSEQSVKELWVQAEDLFYQLMANASLAPATEITTYSMVWYFNTSVASPRTGNAWNMTQISLLDIYNNSFSTILMTQSTSDSGSYAPALWFGNFVQTSPQAFTFSGDRLGPLVNFTAQFTLATGDTSSNNNLDFAAASGTEYVELFDWANSLFYNFTVWSIPSTSAIQMVAVTPFNTITVYLTAIHTDDNPANPDDEPNNYDNVTLILHTQQSDIVYISSTDTWPVAQNVPQPLKYVIPMGDQVVGPLLSISIRITNTRLAAFQYSSETSATFQVNSVWATHSICSFDYTVTNCDESDLVSELYVSPSGTQQLISRQIQKMGEFSLSQTTGSPVSYVYNY